LDFHVGETAPYRPSQSMPSFLFSVNTLDTCAMGGIEGSFTLGPSEMPTPRRRGGGAGL